MKKLVILAILVVSKIALAGPVPEKKALSLHEARTKNVESKETKEYLEAVRKGRVSPTIKATIVKLLQTATSKVGGIDSTNLESLTATRPEALDKVTQLISHVNYGTVEQKAKATSDLRILSEGSKYVSTKAEAELLEKITEMSDYNQAAKNFKAELIKTLSLGKATSIAEAVKIASNGKITLEKIKECII
jgi:histone deacetylase complex regulatory component SIN3